MGNKVGSLRKFLITHGATRILVISLGLLVAFLAMSGYISLQNLDRVRESSGAVAHTQEVLRHSSLVLASALNAETRARGYLISAEESFIVGMRTDAEIQQRELNALEVLVRDNSSQLKRITTLRELFEKHEALRTRLVSEEVSGPGTQGHLNESRACLDQIRQEIAGLNEEENKLLDVRMADARMAQRVSSIITVLQAVIGIALVLIGAYLLQRELTSRLRIEKRVRGLLAELSEQNRRKDEFLATLSHELRNPLAPLTMSASLMRRLEPSDARWAELLQVHDRQLGQMVHLVDDLLDLSRIVSNKIELDPKPIDLRNVLSDAITVSKSECDQKGVILTTPTVEQPVIVHGDQVRLLQVFGNLLNNACKFTPKGGNVGVSIRADQAWVEVDIQDTGRGLDPKDYDLIFSMFSQVKHEDGEMKKGIGIGLTLAKRLVEMHGGELKVFSEGLDKGSVFTIRLPISKESVGASADPAALLAQLSNLRVLIADDNSDAAQTVSMLLSTFGVETAVAYDGERAVEMAFEFKPNLILMDIGMPGMDGLEACRSIRSQSWGKSIFIAALTGWGQDSDKRKTKDAGFDKHLVKPVSLFDLHSLLAECHQRKSE